MTLGAYVGEAIRRKFGYECEWCIEDIYWKKEVLHIKYKDNRIFHRK